MRLPEPDIEKMSHNAWLNYREDIIEKLTALGYELLPNPECSTCDVHDDYVCFDHESLFIYDSREKVNNSVV